MQRIIGVFKGGGAKGALYAGALAAVQERHLWFSEVAGSSAGAITAAFVAAGATPDDLKALEKEGRRLLEFPSPRTSAMNLRNTGGILSFEELRKWLSRSLNDLCASRLGVCPFGEDGPTFDQLAHASGIPLHITCADLVWRAPVVLNARLTPALFVADAAAASSSIPFIFEAPSLRIASDGPSRGILVSDGGVMANLPMFVFSDEGFRTVADLGDRGTDRVVGFTFVDRERPRHTGASGKPGDEYRQRFKPVSRATTLGEELIRGGFDARTAKPAKRRGSASTRWWGLHALAFRLIAVVVRAVETVVLIPLNLILAVTQHRGYRGGATQIPDRRARRWLKFGDGVLELAPLYVIAGVLLLFPVLVFGIPSVLAFLWPDWTSLTSVGGNIERIFKVLIGASLYLLVVMGCVLVIVFAVLGLAGYIIGWVAKPVAAVIGNHLVATFMRNPQEPAWAGEGTDEEIIRILVPEGWNALRSAATDEEMESELKKAQESVGKQLELAGLGQSP